MFISKVQSILEEQFGDGTIDVKNVTEQQLIWDEHTEVRAFCDDGRVYSCLFEGDMQIGKFVLVPTKPEVK